MSGLDIDKFKVRVKDALAINGWKLNEDEGILMLLELMVKRQNGYYSSYTENNFLDAMKVMRKDNFPNTVGRDFMVYMIYKHSNLKAPIYSMIDKYRC